MKSGFQHRRNALVIALSAAYALGSPHALANPNGAQVVSGQAALQTHGNQLTVTNSANAIINWRGFSIGAGETTRFVQPSAASAVLNRVVGSDVSQLLGQLQSNGQVFLINPNGIVIGASARIDTNSFVASTLDIADADFLAGKLRFLDRSGAGGIRNEGLITAGPGGRIALIAPNIENSGIIHAPDGNILLAAGRKLEIASLDLDGIRFEIQAPTDSVLNLGKLLADNGAVRVFAGNLRNSGEIEASRMALDASGQIVLSGSNSVALTADSIIRADGAKGGQVLIQSAQGTSRIDGLVSASGSAGAGGDVRLLGERVALEAGARIVASGSSAGGQILVGGDYQGANADVQNARRVHVAAGATLEANATVDGDGGKIIVWADENTRYQGALSARGGAQGGNGGFAEVSGKQNLEFTGTADLSAPAGAHGSLLLDPLDILVSLTSGILPIVVDEFADFASNVVTVSPLTLAAVGGNVVLQAERDIYVRDAITLTAAGAGLTATAGGALFNAGSIINTAGITTNGGTVSLRGNSISGAGGITTQGGAVDLMTAASLNYSGAIASGGGGVTLVSQNSSVNGANVDAGSGTIAVMGRNISGGSYTTTGTAGFTASTGSIFVNDVNANIVNFNATGAIDGSVVASERVNAASSGSYVQLSNGFNSGMINSAGPPLRLGTISGNSGIYLYSSHGMEQASGGLLTSRYVSLSGNNAASALGSLAAPILISAPSGTVQPEINLSGLTAPAHLAMVGSPTLAALSLNGTVAGLGGSTLTGAGNLSTFSLGQSGGMLDVSAVSSGGLANGLNVSVGNGGINAATLTLPGAPVSLSASAGVTVGAMTAGSLSIQAAGAVNIGTATTTGSSGIYVSTQSCSFGNMACTASSPISAGTLNAGGNGSVSLYAYDNGNVSATNVSAGRDVYLSVGEVYPTSFGFPFTSLTTNNDIVLGTVVAGRNVSVNHNAQGNVTLTSLSAAGFVNIQAGSSYIPIAFNNATTTNNTIAVGNNGPAGATGSFSVYNNGIGNLTVTGDVDRSVSGSIDLSAANGAVTATGNLTARDSIYISAGSASSVAAAATVGNLVSGAGGNSNSGNIYVEASGDLRFNTANASSANVSNGRVDLNSSMGFVRTSSDNTTPDIVATGDVAVRAGTSIGNAAFVNPLDITAGAARTVTLVAGSDIGSPTGVVNVNTNGTLAVTSTAGRFHVAATDGATAQSLSSIRLSASAGGIGSGNSSTFTSADLNVTAASNGNMITISDLVRNTGTLNEFRFDATGTSGLTFGNVNLNTATGINKLVLTSTGNMLQASGNVVAGNLTLDSGSGNLTVGNVTSASTVIASPARNNILSLSGANVNAGNLLADSIVVNGSSNVQVGSVQSTGTHRGFANSAYDSTVFRYPLDELRLTAGATLSTGGNVTSATSAFLTGMTGVSINGGAGAVMGGNFSTNFYTDSVDINAGTGVLAVAAVAAHDVRATGSSLNTGNVTATRFLTLGDASTQSVSTGALSGTSGLTLNAGSFTTGNLSATSGTVSITANATGNQQYAPGSPIAITASSVVVNAPNRIDLATNATVTAPNVTLRATGGNVAANLTGATNLTVDTGGVFNVSSTLALTNLNVTADGSVAGAGAGSVVTGSGQSQTYATTGNQLALQMASATGLANRYAETANSITDIIINTTGTFGSSGSSLIDVSAPVANIAANSVVIGNGSLTLTTAGNIALTSVVTGGGAVSATSFDESITLTSVNSVGGSVTARTFGADAFDNINVQSVVTLGGGVTLTADNGNIVRAGALMSPQIDTRNGQGQATGTTTLNAAGGSVGSAGSRLQTSGAVTLNANAHNDIAIDVVNTTLTNLALTTSASGSGVVSVSDANFAALGITRSGGTDLLLAALSPVSAGGFSLTATDGNIVVGGDIGNVTALALNAGYNLSSGNLVIQASGGPRTISANTYDLRAGQDVLISAGATAGENVSIMQTAASGHNYVYAGRDIVLAANGGSATLMHNALNWTQFLNASRDVVIDGGSAGVANAAASVTSAGVQNITADRNLAVRGGSANQASARIDAVQSQTINQVGGSVMVSGGSGQDAFAQIVSSTSSQSVGNSNSNTTDMVSVQGGSGTGAYALIRAATSQTVQSSGDIRVVGGSATGTDAELIAGSSQTVGSTSTFFNDPTAAILVQGGAGGKARIMAGSTQTVSAGDGISVLGGSGTGTTASIETTAGSQSIGTSGTSFNDPTSDILVRAGTGDAAFASIKASGTQTISTGGTITVQGNSGVGAYGEILSTGGSQSIGSTSTNFNDATGSILVQAGSGGIARIQAQTNQTIRTGGDLSVIGGSGANMTAAVQSMSGFQTIGSTSIFSNDPSGSLLVQAGSGSGAAAFINAATGQTIDAGGTITVAGNASGAFAEIVTTAGNQTIGNVSGSTDRTDTIALLGGSAAGSYARIAAAAGFQTVRTSANLTMSGGAGDNAGAKFQSRTGQTFTVQGDLAVTGGSGSAPGLNETAIRNTTSGNQSLIVSGNMSVTGGGMGSDTWVKQDAAGSQNINVGGTLALLSPAATTNTGVTSIEALGSSQSISVGGAMTIANQAGWLTYVSATGTQSINADSLGITLSSQAPVSSPFAGVTATGNQSIFLRGDGSTVGSATLSIFNTSSLTDSLAAVSTAADQTILMDYNSAGLVQIGSSNGLGKSQIFAGGKHTMVAGQLLIQGGASSAAVAALMVPNDAAVISTIYGPIELKGGAQGAALIDPPTLDMVSNNGVFLLAGAGPGASATINAGIFNLAATQGDLSLISSAAAAAITANVFNYFGGGNVFLTGGTITVTQAGTINITGICYSCDTNLFGPFSVFAFIPPPTDFGALVANNLLALSDLGYGLFDAFYNKDGELELRNRRLNQCY